jgi:uncharacterized protein YjbI with pentapeptide repeats
MGSSQEKLPQYVIDCRHHIIVISKNINPRNGALIGIRMFLPSIKTGTVSLIFAPFLACALAVFNIGCDTINIKAMLKSKFLIGKNLSGLDLYNLNLEKVDFSRTKLIKTNFSFSNLRQSIFINADLREADLSAADLTGADLRGASLRKADARGAIFVRSNLIDAYFYDTDLSGADLRDALFIDLTGMEENYQEIGAMIKQKKIVNYTHLRNADLAGTAIGARWRQFIESQNVRNFNKIVWVK